MTLALFSIRKINIKVNRGDTRAARSHSCRLTLRAEKWKMKLNTAHARSRHATAQITEHRPEPGKALKSSS